MNRIYTLEDARKLVCESVVYGLCTREGEVFYVGKTTRPHERFRLYSRNKEVHSSALSKKLETNKFVRILEWNPEDLTKAEMKHIRARRDTGILNKVGVTLNRDMAIARPWSRGGGYLTPSKYLMRIADASLAKEIREHRSKLTTLQRCVYEINIFRNFPESIQERLEPWLEATAKPMIQYMEQHV